VFQLTLLGLQIFVAVNQSRVKAVPPKGAGAFFSTIEVLSKLAGDELHQRAERFLGAHVHEKVNVIRRDAIGEQGDVGIVEMLSQE
jgi:hypothetical protein